MQSVIEEGSMANCCETWQFIDKLEDLKQHSLLRKKNLVQLRFQFL